jgi:hypothetical protein
MGDDYRERFPLGAPHCDARILHAPGECEYCDGYPDWQMCRERWGIAFTGHEPKPGQHPCPADVARPPGSDSDHRTWGGNRPTNPGSDIPPERFDSQVFYGSSSDGRRWLGRVLGMPRRGR